MRTLVITAFLLLSPILQMSDTPVASVASGMSATITMDDDGTRVVDTGVAPPLVPYEMAAIAKVWGGDGAYNIGVLSVSADRGEIPKPPPVNDNRIRFKVVHFPGKQTNLIVENGYDRPVKYSVLIHYGKTSMADTTCEVTPHKRSIEHWPYNVDVVDLREMLFIPLHDGQPLDCS